MRRGQEGLRCLLDATVRGWQFRGTALRGGGGMGGERLPVGGGLEKGWDSTAGKGFEWWKIVENDGKWWKMVENEVLYLFHGALCFLLLSN